jgi:hypothetical protein
MRKLKAMPMLAPILEDFRIKSSLKKSWKKYRIPFPFTLTIIEDKLGHLSKTAQRVVRGNPQASSSKEDRSRKISTLLIYLRTTHFCQVHSTRSVNYGIHDPPGGIL